MSKSLAIGGAMILLAAFTSSAGAGVLGGITAPGAMSRGDARIPMTSSITSVRTFSPEGHSFGPDGRQLGGKEHWKKPIDSEGGGPLDPPKKHPTKTSGNGISFDGIIPDNRVFHYTYPHNPHHYGYGDTGQPLACRGRPGGC
jgi:hypothetical protein